MSNSPLTSYTKLSPNHSGTRNHTIDRISPHCVVGQLSVESMGGWFSQKASQSSCNYGIGSDGRILLCVEEKNRSWCTSSAANDHRAVTIECASDTTDPYTMNSKVYNSLINLCVDICQRNGKKKLLWFPDKSISLSYTPKQDEMIITVHRWFANKSCPGDWLYSRLGNVANEVTKQLSGETEEEEVTQQQFNSMMENWLANKAKETTHADWSAPARQWAEDKGYIQGDEKGNKMYKKFLTREEFFTVLYRILGNK